MRVVVKIEGKTFEVDIEDIQHNPIIARVDGRTYEVTILNSQTTDTSDTLHVSETSAKNNGNGNHHHKIIPKNGRLKKPLSTNVIYAPIPGVVVQIDVKENQEVQAGQIIFVIEAMKMKNFIRAPKKGVIKSIPVSIGKAVQTNEILAYFIED
ncbi:MAG: biotin/lipoyl-containing protein [Anaerolineales bacterium]